MSTYLLWLVWGGLNVYLASAFAWMFYRLGFKAGATHTEREAALAALSDAPASVPIHDHMIACVACKSGDGTFFRTNCDSCDAIASGQHLHLACKNCGYKYIVQPK